MFETLRRCRRPVVASCAIVLVLAAAACGGDAAPDRGDQGSTPGSNDESPSEQFSYEVWFLKGEALQSAMRTEELTPSVGDAAMTALLDGPSTGEIDLGLGTAIPGDTELLGLDVDGGVATVDLTSAYESGGGSLSMRLRLAQVVYTLTQFPTISNVAFRLDGEPISTFSAEGVSVDKPLERADFEDLLPPISVDSPVPGAEISTPVTITGTANVFEATVSIRILDSGGAEIAKTFTTATCGTGCRGDYSEAVRFEVSERQPGTIEVYESSAEDGSQLFTVSIPVTLVPGTK